MTSDKDTAQAAAWYLAATPARVTQWLVRLWRATAALELVVVVAAFLLPAGTFPLRWLAPLLAAAALISIERASRRAGARPTPRMMTAAHLVLQVALLTGLLELSGGPSNPFSVVYAVQIALAAVTLGAGWGAAIAGWVAVCYGLLISWHLEELVPDHHRLIDFPTHLFTMWLAIAIVASGVDSSCAAPAASVVSDTSRSVRAAWSRMRASSASWRATARDAAPMKCPASSSIVAIASHIVKR